jgi:hypothetical protein
MFPLLFSRLWLPWLHAPAEVEAHGALPLSSRWRCPAR